MRIPLVTLIKWNQAQDVTYEDLPLSADDAPPIAQIPAKAMNKDRLILHLFISKLEAKAMVLYRFPPIVKYNPCQYPNL